MLKSALTILLGLTSISYATTASDTGTLRLEEPWSAQLIQEYAEQSANTICEVVETILSIPAEEQTFENTLESWDQLETKLSISYHVLHHFADSNSSLSHAATHAKEDLNGLFSEVLAYPPLKKHLFVFSQRYLQEQSSSLQQKSVAAHFIHRIATHNFNILPIRHSGSNDDGKAGGSARVGMDYSWGGRDGPEFKGYAEVEAHDGRGNYFEGRIEQNDKGEGRVHAEGGHDKN